MPRGEFILDYALLGVLSRKFTRFTIVLFYVILLIIDAVLAFSPVYYFRLPEALVASQYVLYLNIWITLRVAAFALAIAAAFSVIAVILSPPDNRLGVWGRIILVTIAGLLIVGDIANGTSSLASFFPKQAQVSRVPLNIVGSGLYKLMYATADKFSETYRGTDSDFRKVTESATFRLRMLLASAQSSSQIDSNHVVLVMVESLGIFKNEEANEALMSPFFRPTVTDRYNVTIGNLAFDGSTTDAELRELCGVRGSYAYVREPLPMCLPWSFRRLGFRTMAIHGFKRNMFDRFRWYPHLGFEKILFAEDIFTSGRTQLCGAGLRGVCDREAAQLLRNELLGALQGERGFVYWLTLNSHLPVDGGSATGSDFECKSNVVASRDHDVCLLMKIWYGVFSAIVGIATDSTLPSTHFIVVGDHSPGFLLGRKRNLFVEGQVPFIELMPVR